MASQSKSGISFSFGKNWMNYSRHVDAEAVEKAEKSLLDLLDNQTDAIKGKTFLDIGCGSGLFSIAAWRQGARQVTGVDVDPFSVETSQRLQKKFGVGSSVEFRVGSILDRGTLGKLEKADLVYAWGSLHHTGEMWRAIDNAASLVNGNGTLIIAIYNKHRTSSFWKTMKQIYNRVPAPLKFLMVMGYMSAFFPYRWVMLKGEPLTSRGMMKYYDVVDWLGGLPYEYATPQEIQEFLRARGFALQKIIPTHGMTGCNQFVFRKE